MTALSLLRSLERARVARHIQRAESIARAEAPRGLGLLQRLLRKLLLDELAWYRRRAQFPRNDLYREQTPLFIDRHGTRCAMAHLLELGGERGLVQRIHGSRNRARIAELADEPGLLAWLAAAGLTVAEAAAIQPGYCDDNVGCVCSAGVASVSGEFPRVRTVLEGTIERGTGNGPTSRVRLTAVYGEASRYAVGDALEVVGASSNELGGTTIIPLRNLAQPAGVDGYIRGTPIYEGQHLCDRHANRDLTVDKDRLIAALLSADCRETVASWGAEWRDRDCSELGGCSTQASAHGDSLGTAAILLTLLANLTLRKLRRRRGRTV